MITMTIRIIRLPPFFSGAPLLIGPILGGIPPVMPPGIPSDPAGRGGTGLPPGPIEGPLGVDIDPLADGDGGNGDRLAPGVGGGPNDPERIDFPGAIACRETGGGGGSGGRGRFG